MQRVSIDVGRAHVGAGPSTPSPKLGRVACVVELKQALVTMGYTRSEARAAVEIAIDRCEPEATLEQPIVAALRACPK